MPKPPIEKKLGGKKSTMLILGGGGLAIVGYLYYRRKAASAPQTLPANDPNAMDPNATYDPTQYDPYGGYSSGGGSYSGSAGIPTSAPVDTSGNVVTGDPASNQDWLHQALDALVQNGYDTSGALAALTASLAGAPLTTDQQGAVATAHGSVGAPPQPTPTVTHAAPLPAGYGLHTVSSADGGINAIAAKYGLTLSQLRAYNPTFNFGAPLKSGEVLQVRAATGPVVTRPVLQPK